MWSFWRKFYHWLFDFRCSQWLEFRQNDSSSFSAFSVVDERKALAKLEFSSTMWQVNTWGRVKMSAIFCRQHLYINLLLWTLLHMIQISLKFVPRAQSTMNQHWFRHWLDLALDTPLSEDGRTSLPHYSDAIMSVIASQITGVSIVFSTVCSGADQRKH